MKNGFDPAGRYPGDAQKGPRPRTRQSAHDPRDRNDARQGAVVSLAVLAALFTAAFIFAPLLDATPFWQDHFGAASSRIGLLIYGSLILFGVLARTWNPLTWESELVARGAKALAHAGLFWWLLVPLLDAPRLAALAIFPLLLAAPLATLVVARHAAALGAPARRIVAAGAWIAASASLLIVILVWNDPGPILLAAAALPLSAVHLLAPPWSVRQARQQAEHTETTAAAAPGHTAPLDLPAGTVQPPGGMLTLIVTLGGLLVILLVVAPGLPLTAPIAWAALVASLPLVSRALMARGGTAHPRALPGPVAMRRHESRIATIPDERLHRLDDAIERFLSLGAARKDLAEQIALLLQEADEEASTKRIEDHLRRLPRWPWARRAREQGLVKLLRDGLLNAEVRT